MATTWDRTQNKRTKTYERILSEVRINDVLGTLTNEMGIALQQYDDAHIYAIKDVSIMLFLEAQMNFKDIQVKYADIFDSLQKQCKDRAGKSPDYKIHNLAGFFEALYGSLIVLSSLTPNRADVEFVTQIESYMKTLEILHEERRISPTSLGKHLSMTPQRGSQILKELQQRELVRPIEKVGRTRLYSLTRAGNVMIEYFQRRKNI